MAKKFTFLVLVIVLLGAQTVRAEQNRTLKERVKSVSNRLYIKSERLELTLLPLTSISFNDAFYQKLGGGLAITYHFSERWAVDLVGTYSLNVEKSRASYYSGEGDVDVPCSGKRTFLVNADAMWSLVYGKISLAAEYVMHFDTYIILGIGAVGSEYKDSNSHVSATLPFGLGVRLFFTRLFALRLELKDYVVFNDKVSWGAEHEASSTQHQLMFNLGLSFFFLSGKDGQ